MDIDQIIDMLTASKKGEEIDFIYFGMQLAQRYEDSGRSSVNIMATLNSLCRYRMCNTLNISEINLAFLRDYEQWLSKNTKGRAISLYIGNIRTIHNQAKLQYNDEDSGRILVPQSPFSRYIIPKPPSTRKRSLTAEQIKKIIDLPYIEVSGTRGHRFNLAKDVFLLSFYLIGMNSVDLFTCTNINNGRITYNRQKTCNRRDDNAEISILIPKEATELLEKYKDPYGHRIFNFHKNYSDHRNFNQALNQGLKQIGKVLDIEDLEFYAARHSWATIAINDVGIDKYTVHLGLNHADPTMRVTDIYIKKDYSILDDANRKVIRFVSESAAIVKPLTKIKSKH